MVCRGRGLTSGRGFAGEPVGEAIRIARAEVSQASELTAIAFAAKRYWGYPEEWIDLWADELTISEEYISANDVFSASHAGRIVGWLAVSQKAQDCWLDHCWVVPEEVGQGIGKQLVAWAFVYAAEAGSPMLKVIADPNAEAFYQKQGFLRVGDYPSVPAGRMLPLMQAPVEALR